MIVGAGEDGDLGPAGTLCCFGGDFGVDVAGTILDDLACVEDCGGTDGGFGIVGVKSDSLVELVLGLLSGLQSGRQSCRCFSGFFGGEIGSNLTFLGLFMVASGGNIGSSPVPDVTGGSSGGTGGTGG